MSNTCEQIMLDRDTCGEPGHQCMACPPGHYFCAQCFSEHHKIHQPKPAERTKFEINLSVCTVCESVRGNGTVIGTCLVCGSTMEPLKAALKADGRTVVFYVEE